MKTAIKLGSFFKRGKRDNGESFVTLTDDRPQWLYDAVHEAHGKDLPNDWIYAECEAACDAIDDGSIDVEARYYQDAISEHTDGRVDIYTRDLYQWSADMCHSYTWSYAEEEAKDLGSADVDTEKRIAMIQYCAIQSIVDTIVEAWKEAKEESADDDTEESEGPSKEA